MKGKCEVDKKENQLLRVPYNNYVETRQRWERISFNYAELDDLLGEG